MATNPRMESLWPQDDPGVMQDTSLLEGQYKYNLTAPGLAASFQSSFESGFAYKLFNKAYDSYEDKHLPNNKILTPEQAKESPDYRPGIHVENGISEYMLKRASEEYDRKQRQEFAVSLMPDGLLSKVERGGMDIIGAALDPVTLTATVLAPEATVGIRGSAFLAKAATPVTKFAAGGIVGVAEGGLSSVPTVIADLTDENKYLPEDNKAAHAMWDFAAFAGLGGVIHGFTGVKQPISKRAAQYANQVSVNQVAEGMFPSVDLIVQQGYKDARENQGAAASFNPQEIEAQIPEKFLSEDDKKAISEKEQELLAPLEQNALERVKDTKTKGILGQISDLRNQRKQLKSSENVNQLATERRTLNPDLNFKTARDQALKLIKKDTDEIDKKLNDFQKVLNDKKIYSEAQVKLRRFKRSLSGQGLQKIVDAGKKADIENQAMNSPEVRNFSLFAEDALKNEVQNLDKAREDMQPFLSNDLVNDKDNKNPAQIVSEVLDEMDNPKDELGESAKKYAMNKLPDYLRRAVGIMRKLPQYRTQAEVQDLLKTLFTDEEKRIKQDSRNIKKRLNGDISDAERLLLENELKNLKSRLAEVKKAKEQHGDFWNVKQTFDASLLKKYDILKTLKQNDVYKMMTPDTGTAVDGEQLRAAVSNLMDTSNDLALSQNQKVLYDQAADMVPEDLKEAFDNASQIIDSLPPEKSAPVKEQMRHVATATKTITKALEKAAKCLGGINE
jgi:hypothetical protein